MQRVRQFFNRHRRGVAITAAVAGAGYLAYTYLREKIREASEASSAERSDQEKYPSPARPRSFLLRNDVVLGFVADAFWIVCVVGSSRINRIVCSVFSPCIRTWRNRFWKSYVLNRSCWIYSKRGLLPRWERVPSRLCRRVTKGIWMRGHR